MLSWYYDLINILNIAVYSPELHSGPLKGQFTQKSKTHIFPLTCRAGYPSSLSCLEEPLVSFWNKSKQYLLFSAEAGSDVTFLSLQDP